MSTDNVVANHYGRGNLIASIRSALETLGKSVELVEVADLHPVDEFHVGGRLATERLMEHFDLSAGSHLIDVGCGLGGAARYVATKYNCRVTGIDLTPEYIETGQMLNSWVDLQERVTLSCGSAVRMPFADASFDGGYMLHVGMNIGDKVALFAEISRVLKPGSIFAVYDIVRSVAGELAYPVPWASESSASELATTDQYLEAMTTAGLTVSTLEDRREFAIEFFDAMKAKNQANGGPPPLGLHTLMGESSAVKFGNMIDGIAAGLIAPFEIIAQKVR